MTDNITAWYNIKHNSLKIGKDNRKGTKRMKKIRKMIGVLFMTCILLFTSVTQSEAATAKLTQSEKKVYTRWMISGIKKSEYGTYYNSKRQGIMFGPKFYVYDINGDGHKDVIVTGLLGLRSMSYSEIYMHVDGKYRVIPVKGSLYGVSSQGIYTVEDDYTGAGAEYYKTLTLYKFDKHGRITKHYEYMKTTTYYDMDRNIRYKNGKISQTCKSIVGNRSKNISIKEFRRVKSHINKYNVSKKMHTLNSSNIRRYLK